MTRIWIFENYDIVALEALADRMVLKVLYLIFDLSFHDLKLVLEMIHDTIQLTGYFQSLVLMR
jgi:hypothetical protein